MSKGAIWIHRDITDHWLWKKSKPFSVGQAWIDLLLLANHKNNKTVFRGEIITIERGCMIRSERDLSSRWGWSQSAVHRFLNLLEVDQMIVKKVNQKANHITICNYDKWQVIRINHESIMNQSRINPESILTLNNNDNNENNEKEEKICIPQNGTPPYSEIIAYLNEKTKQAYRASSKKSQICIHARWKDGFLVDDFKYVVDIKVSEWAGTEFEKFLRPETLFGPKMENYRNQKFGKAPLSRAGMKTAQAAMQWLSEQEEKHEG